MREDLSNDGGVLDRGDQLHPTSAADKASRAGSYGQKPPDANHWSGEALDHGAS